MVTRTKAKPTRDKRSGRSPAARPAARRRTTAALRLGPAGRTKLLPRRASAGGELRPERIQRRLSAGAIEAHLASLPGWRLAADRRSIGCALSFPAYPLAIVFLNLVTGLAELSGYYPEIAVRGARVSLRLAAPRGGGLTAEIFEFARLVEGTSALAGGASARGRAVAEADG